MKPRLRLSLRSPMPSPHPSPEASPDPSPDLSIVRPPSRSSSPRSSPRSRPWARRLAGLGLAVLAPLSQAATGPMDFLFGSGSVPASESSAANPRIWKFGEFSALRLVPRESGAPANEHPAALPPEAARAALASIELTLRPGRNVPLFVAGELADMVPSLVAAFAAATPDDDVLLLSTARREDGVLSTPMSTTARLFIRAGALQLIVQEARANLYATYRATRFVPTLGFGSRSAGAAGPAVTLRSAAGTATRADWLALNLQPVVAAPTLPAMSTGVSTGVSPVATQAAPAAATNPPRPAPPADAAAPNRPRDASFFDEQAQRLRGLKRLRDEGLIGEDEYERKRRDIVQSL